MRRRPILNIVAGPLGVGKTSAVLDFLHRHRREGERLWALVNDFGALGLDADTVSLAGDLQVRRVPGGCVCCSAAAGLHTGLQAALEDGADRVLLEPSGMVALDQLLAVLDSLGLLAKVDRRATVVLIDPARVTKTLIEKMPYFEHLVGSADVLVANRWSLATPAQREHFQSWAPDDALTTDYGVLPPGTWDKPSGAGKSGHGHAHQAEAAKSDSRTWPPGVIFDHQALAEALERAGLLRFKGVFRTDLGMRRIERAMDRVESVPTQDKGPSRAEWILEGPLEGFAESLERAQRT